MCFWSVTIWQFFCMWAFQNKKGWAFLSLKYSKHFLATKTISQIWYLASYGLIIKAYYSSHKCNMKNFTCFEFCYGKFPGLFDIYIYISQIFSQIYISNIFNSRWSSAFTCKFWIYESLISATTLSGNGISVWEVSKTRRYDNRGMLVTIQCVIWKDFERELPMKSFHIRET